MQLKTGKQIVSVLLILSMLLSMTACSGAKSQQSILDDEDAAWALLADAYTYVFPLMMTDATKMSATNTEQPDLVGHAPVNQLIHAQKLATAESKLVVTPNVDTVYTQAWIDVNEEPIFYVLPETDRFCKVQILDAWTNTVAVLEEAGVYAFVSDEQVESVPDGVEAVVLPTQTAWMIARVLSNGPDDMPAVYGIQNEMQMYPLSAYQDPEAYVQPKGTYDEANNVVPVDYVLAMDLERYFARANELMMSNEPAEADKILVESFKELNIGPGLTFDMDQLPGDITARTKELKQNLKTTLVSDSQSYNEKLGDWNYFGAPIGDFGTAYSYRALIALAGLGANPVEVAIYPKLANDQDGADLVGSNTYKLHVESVPPTLEDGFWSITAYGSDDFLIENELERYCINDRSSCIYNEDGSLDIILSANAPDDISNWLPVGEDTFHLVMRIYTPDMKAIENWTAPVIQLVK